MKVFTKDEQFHTREPSAKYCKKCKYAFPIVEVSGHKFDKRIYAVCEKYERKPHDVLWDDAECEEFKEA